MCQAQGESWGYKLKKWTQKREGKKNKWTQLRSSCTRRPGMPRLITALNNEHSYSALRYHPGASGHSPPGNWSLLTSLFLPLLLPQRPFLTQQSGHNLGSSEMNPMAPITRRIQFSHLIKAFLSTLSPPLPPSLCPSPQRPSSSNAPSTGLSGTLRWLFP